MVSAEYLLRHNPQPSVEEIREGLSGNLCRCAELGLDSLEIRRRNLVHLRSAS